MKILKAFKLSTPEREATDLNILYGFLLFTIFSCIILFCINWFYPTIDDIPYLLIGGLNLFLLALLNYTKSKFLVGNLYLGIWVAILVNMSFYSGGVYSMDTFSVAFIPLMAIALIDHKSGLGWFVFYLAYIWYMWTIIETPELDDYYRAQTLVFNKTYYVVGGMVLATFTSGIIGIFYFQNRSLITKLKAKEIALKEHVSQLNRQSALLKKTEEDLKRSNSELEKFAHVTSHDLKQPLVTINNFANLLQGHLKKKKIEDKDTTQMLQFIVAGSNKMKSLITDLLDFATLKKEGEIAYSRMKIEELLDSVQADLKGLIDSNGVTIKKNNLPALFVIPVKINQLLQNLISNAIKFRKKEEPLVIQIGAIEKNKHWEFFIKDNGIGIDKEFQHKIFEPFKKLHHSSVYSGSGIGLATCMHIVKLHNGNIWLESERGKGSTFFFTIAKDLQTIPTENSVARTAENSTLLQTIHN